MKCAAVHLAFNYAEAWAAGNSSTAASVFAGASERHLFSPHSSVLKQMLTLQPSPQFGAYLPNRVGFQTPPSPLWKERIEPPAPNLTATWGDALAALPQSKLVNPQSMHGTPHLSCWTVKSPKRMAGKEMISNALPSAWRGRRQRRAGKVSGAELSLSLSIPSFGDQLSSDSCREVPAWHQGWPQA